jgi:preprotein translocase subunit SecE
MERIKQTAEKVKQFLVEARNELKKVTWPTRKQALASTSVVIIVVVIVSLFLGVVDFGLTKIIKLVLG